MNSSRFLPSFVKIPLAGLPLCNFLNELSRRASQIESMIVFASFFKESVSFLLNKLYVYMFPFICNTFMTGP